MARIFMNLPNESVVGGRLVPNTPTGHRERIKSQSAFSFYPIWPHGIFQAFSRDILDQTLQPENREHVITQDSSYVFPWSDRATGVLLERAQIRVRHHIFLKGVHFMCDRERFTCGAYWNTISFHCGFGMSGKSEANVIAKLACLDRFYNAQQQCHPSHHGFRPEDHYFSADQEFLQRENSSYWLSFGCAFLDGAGVALLSSLDKIHRRAAKEVAPVSSRKCAEQLYQRQTGVHELKLPPVGRHTPKLSSTERYIGAFSRAFTMKLNASADTASPGRLSYIQNGHLSNSLHYFCPRGCNTNGSKCFSCDHEAEYLRRYPDVDAALKHHVFDSGSQHFLQHGSAEGRVWSCQSKHLPPGKGSKQECYDTFSSFIKMATPHMGAWQVSGAKDFQINPPSCNALVFAEGRDHAWMTFSLKTHRRYLGPLLDVLLDRAQARDRHLAGSIPWSYDYNCYHSRASGQPFKLP